MTATSQKDEYNRGVKDASRDLQGLNGHRYDSSCPSGHTSVFCEGYVQGYDATWPGGSGSSGTASGTSRGESRTSLVDKICNFVHNIPEAEATVTLLEYPNVGAAVSAICVVR